jgi:hypothetical protein
MNKGNELEYQELSIWNLNSILNYIKENFFQIFLLILVCIIIYTVDYISNINIILFSMPTYIPGIGHGPHQNIQQKLIKKQKKIKK